MDSLPGLDDFNSSNLTQFFPEKNSNSKFGIKENQLEENTIIKGEKEEYIGYFGNIAEP